jgi:hypothetical protein
MCVRMRMGASVGPIAGGCNWRDGGGIRRGRADDGRDHAGASASARRAARKPRLTTQTHDELRVPRREEARGYG